MIRFAHVQHDFGRGLVVQDVDVALAPGKVTVLCGPNAAGKTTLLRIGAGLLTPVGGEVFLNDVAIGSMSGTERARLLGFMPQRFECASGFSVQRVLELAHVMTGRKPKALARVIDEFDLHELCARSIGTLSVGQCQRVALARVLAQIPNDGVVLLDEPFSALDPHWEQRATEVLRARAREGATVALSVHALTTAGRMADDVLLLRQGSLAASGPVEEVLTAETLEGAFGVGFELVLTSDGQRLPIPKSQVRTTPETL